MKRVGGIRLWLAILAAATVLALIFATQIFLDASYQGDASVGWREALQVAFADWYFWALLAPLVEYLSCRFPLEPGRLFRSVVAHGILGLLLTFAKVAGEGALAQLLTSAWIPPTALKVYFNVFVYWTLVGVFHGVKHYRRLRERERLTAELESRLAEAKLDALRGQLRPHFLFNALNAISSLMHRDVEAADAMLERLAALLRRSLDGSDAQETPLSQEMELLDAYLEIEKARLGDRLAVRVDVAPDACHMLVPSFVLQPLAENAVRHGIARRVGGGQLEIRASRANGRLIVEVRDDGPGPGAEPRPEGIGLSTTRRRLEQLYGTDHELVLSRREGGGAVVRMEIPAREPEA